MNPAPILPVTATVFAETCRNYVASVTGGQRRKWARDWEMHRRLAAALRFHSPRSVRPIPSELLHTPVRYGVPW